MYTKPPQWNSSAVATPHRTGYSQPMPGANQSVNRAAENSGNPSFSPSQQQPGMYQTAPKAQAQPVNTPRNPPVTPAPVAPPAAPAANPADNAKKKESSDASYISQKICKINAKNKVVDFNSKLTMAHINDFANIHGCGGSGHAGNSTIGIVICDFTKGTGDNSITVQYNLDVEDIGFLYEAAMFARLGMLKPDPGINRMWIEQTKKILESWKPIPKLADGSRPIPAKALNALGATLNNAIAATTAQLTEPLFSYSREKNNPYVNKNGLSPCSKVTISYTPYRKDGAPSSYPWYIAIENFDAPLNVGKNGASSHNSNKAVNKHSAFINVSNDDFCSAMVSVQRFVSLWEHRTIPMMNEAYRRIEAARTEKENQTTRSYA